MLKEPAVADQAVFNVGAKLQSCSSCHMSAADENIQTAFTETLESGMGVCCLTNRAAAQSLPARLPAGKTAEWRVRNKLELFLPFQVTPCLDACINIEWPNTVGFLHVVLAPFFK